MQNINFDQGYKEYTLNGDKNCVIRFMPSDLNMMSRMKEAAPVIENIYQKYANIQGSDADISDVMMMCDKEIREQINYIFGNDVCTAAFGSTNCMSPVGGTLLYQRFLEDVISMAAKDIDAERAKVEKNIKKYTSQVKKA